jgi:hypothetical protein
MQKRQGLFHGIGLGLNEIRPATRLRRQTGRLRGLSAACSFGGPISPSPEHALGSRQERSMLKRETFAIADIYVPVKRRATLKPATVAEIAASILDVGQQSPILVRRDGERLVLVEGLHRLEACKALGEQTIVGYLVDARKH